MTGGLFLSWLGSEDTGVSTLPEFMRIEVYELSTGWDRSADVTVEMRLKEERDWRAIVMIAKGRDE